MPRQGSYSAVPGSSSSAALPLSSHDADSEDLSDLETQRCRQRGRRGASAHDTEEEEREQEDADGNRGLLSGEKNEEAEELEREGVLLEGKSKDWLGRVQVSLVACRSSSALFCSLARGCATALHPSHGAYSADPSRVPPRSARSAPSPSPSSSSSSSPSSACSSTPPHHTPPVSNPPFPPTSPAPPTPRSLPPTTRAPISRSALTTKTVLLSRPTLCRPMASLAMSPSPRLEAVGRVRAPSLTGLEEMGERVAWRVSWQRVRMGGSCDGMARIGMVSVDSRMLFHEATGADLSALSRTDRHPHLPRRRARRLSRAWPHSSPSQHFEEGTGASSRLSSSPPSLTLTRLVQRAEYLQPVFPSLTFVNHWSIL
jgi:hypothetical protein